MIKFTINGTLPSLNELIDAERRNRYLGATLKKKSESIVLHSARQLGKWRATSAVHFTYKFYEPNRRRDKDNVSSLARKVIQDALVKGGYLPNDNWEWVEGFEDQFYVDKKNPRIEVCMEEVE